jgi:hypothetical protein
MDEPTGQSPRTGGVQTRSALKAASPVRARGSSGGGSNSTAAATQGSAGVGAGGRGSLAGAKGAPVTRAVPTLTSGSVQARSGQDAYTTAVPAGA